MCESARMTDRTETLSPALPEALEEATCALLEAAAAQDLTLASAESCTGGMLASLLTDVPGLAHVFERGFVTYTDASKSELLGVPAAIIAAEGAVSEAVARAMAKGALDHSQADIALAVTGFADVGDEPCLVHLACARRGQGIVHRECHFGARGRGANRIASLEAAIEMMRGMV